MKKKVLRSILISSITLLGFNNAASAQPGSIDSTFGVDGIVITNFGAMNSAGFSTVIQPDGKILVVGQSSSPPNTNFAISRYNTNGSLDLAFGVGGKMTTDFAGLDDGAGSVALQSDGKIVVAGYREAGGNYNFALARYDTGGGLDGTFGSGGKVTTAIGPSHCSGTAVAIQSDGKIVVAGNVAGTMNNDFAVARYTATGSLDLTFDTDGIQTTDFGGANNIDEVNGMCIQADGKIILTGRTGAFGVNFGVARYTTTGSLDGTFGTGGLVTTSLGMSPYGSSCVKVQSDGKILVSGSVVSGSDLDFALVRYSSTGVLDNSFDTDGITITDFVAGDDQGKSIAIQSDGKILVGGTSGYRLALVRYETNGSLDNTFGTSGKVSTIVGTTDIGYSIALQSDGRIVICGSTDYNTVIARYNSTSGVGIAEFSQLKDLSVYPNPNNGMFILETLNGNENKNFIITDIKGNTVLSGKIIGDKTVVDLSKYENGTYLLQIDNQFVKLIKN